MTKKWVVLEWREVVSEIEGNVFSCLNAKPSLLQVSSPVPVPQT
jgi:hypothetical protein